MHDYILTQDFEFLLFFSLLWLGRLRREQVLEAYEGASVTPAGFCVNKCIFCFQSNHSNFHRDPLL